VRGFVPQDGGSPSRVETHGEVPIITKILDDSGSSIILSRIWFSDPTKQQVGRDQQAKDIMNDHQGKALKEGCHERESAWMSVPSREKNNTKGNLVIVTTKSKSRMQEVSNRCVGQMGNELRC